MRKFSLILFALATAGVLFSEIAHISWLHLVSKPLIMLSLLLYYWLSVPAEVRSRPVILAIVFCFLGDVLLMNKDYFILGLVAFLIGHVMYIFAYRQHQFEDTANALFGIQRIRLAFPIILAATGLVVILLPVLGDLKIPVILYATVLAVMVINALFRYGRTTSPSFWLVFGGAVLFMASDSILAINKFLMHITLGEFYIMLTYTAAQLFIIEGLVRHPQQ
jgi:uncharacterized membrane protein YhhN